MSEMMAAAAWEDAPKRIDFLAHQLKMRRVALFLGAGASFGFDLPDWPALTNRLLAAASVARPAGLATDEAVVEWLRSEHLKESDLAFAKRVADALYEKYDSSIAAIEKNPLLRSLFSLFNNSQKGRVTRVVSFNFDDLVERFLRHYGQTVNSPTLQPAWRAISDVEVLHPHGLLSSDKKIATPIVFSEGDFDRIHAGFAAAWDITLDSILQSHTCIFIGLSGADPRLRAALQRNKARHVSAADKHMFWGVWYDWANHVRRHMWTHNGVFHRAVSDQSETPAEILEICRRAAELTDNV